MMDQVSHEEAVVEALLTNLSPLVVAADLRLVVEGVGVHHSCGKHVVVRQVQM